MISCESAPAAGDHFNKQWTYGTAGFRTVGSTMKLLVYRMGALASLRSKVFKGKATGIMITASHNPAADNGVKIVDPDGGMLTNDWEGWATKFANAVDFGAVVRELTQALGVDESAPALVYIARDTRPTSPELTAEACRGVRAVTNAKCLDLGLLTTPQLHFAVRQHNLGLPNSVEDYYTMLGDAFAALCNTSETTNYKRLVHVDCSNGIGAPHLLKLIEKIPQKLVELQANHTGTDDLNFECGADFVKVSQKAPAGMTLESNVRYASLDGDADRIVYYSVSPRGDFLLLDGDRIATLVASFIKGLLKEAELDITMGIVQTAYANGGSTDYIKGELQVPVLCVPTGVKHLHHAAVSSFDIGIYFEANGHGTVVFSPAAISKFEMTDNAAAMKLLQLSRLINQAIGDALSDLLLVEVILSCKDWDVSDWLSPYEDLPNRQLKVSVKDRTLITTSDAERCVVTPTALQPKINELAYSVTRGRAFVRPSGTEDVVRVYAEAATREEADLLASRVAGVTYALAGGVGPRP